MAIELREEVDVDFKLVNNIKESFSALESLPYGTISPDSIMVDMESIHSVITKNLNYYEPHCLEMSVPKWTTPYQKPVIMHHNDKNGTIIGRIKHVEYTEKNTRSKTPGLIFTCNIGNKEGIEGVKNGTLATVSIGAIVYDLRCSICGQNLAKDGECEHVKGRKYDGKLCFWIVKEMEPKEVSYVIVPSDKYAHNIKVYEPTVSSSLVTEFYKDNEVNKLSLKDLYHNEIAEQIAQMEAEKLENGQQNEEEKPQENNDNKDDNKDEPNKNESDKDEDKNKDDNKDENNEDESKDEDKIKELENKVEKLSLEVANLKTRLSSEEKLRESAELELLKIRKAQKKSLSEKVNELRQSLGLETENIDSLIESTEEVLNSKIETLEEFVSNTSKSVKKLPQLQSKSLVEEEIDNTCVDEKNKKDAIDIEKALKEKYKKLIGR